MISIARIIRIVESDEGTFGVLKINEVPVCVTLEPKDEENATNISSIPAQQYICKRVVTPKHGECFEVMNVPGRTSVLFHKGNVSGHTQGCIILGQKFGSLSGVKAVLSSKNAFYEFMFQLENHNEFHLTIVECY